MLILLTDISRRGILENSKECDLLLFRRDLHNNFMSCLGEYASNTQSIWNELRIHMPMSFLCYRLRTGLILTHRLLRCTVNTRMFSFFFLEAFTPCPSSATF